MQLTGYPGVPDFKTLTAHFVHTDYELTGSIGFSDPMLDAVQHITRTAAMSNFQSIPTDCPQVRPQGKASLLHRPCLFLALKHSARSFSASAAAGSATPSSRPRPTW